MQIPNSIEIPVHILAACFNNTSATYKFYWFLSILQSIENGHLTISKRDLFSRMISNAWYTVNYFHVSFGKQDIIQKTIHVINGLESISIDEKQNSVFDKLSSTTNQNTLKQLWHFNKNVPHWFLTPWFPKIKNETDVQLKKRIYNQSKSFNNKCIYALFDEELQINPDWVNYLTKNTKFLKDFCLWNLALYLQTKNPSVPDIPNKLIKPAVRNSLTPQRKQFWDLVLQELGSVRCIYTNEKLTIGNYAVEHFIPYNFVSHDLIWNLIPAEKSFNSSKSDKLPPLEKYFNPFFELHITAIKIIKKRMPENRLLSDYLTIFPDLDNSITKRRFKESIQPLIIIASNNGFEFLK